MKIKSYCIIYTIIFYQICNLLSAQSVQLWTPIFENLNNTASFFNANAFVGGLANPQFSTIDIDNDGRKDLLVFDRVGNVWLPFKNEATQAGQIKYIYQPQWRSIFPSTEIWALLRDYNCDGLEDIFCHYRVSSLGYIGIAVYEASRNTSNNELTYTLIKDMLLYEDNTLPQPINNIFVSTIDIPAIDDIDGDGDMDILTFNAAGGYLEYFQNQSQELGYNCDSLIFKIADNCWGRFYESGVNESIDLSNRIDSCANYSNWTPIRHSRHAGSTVSTLDYDNDGDKDLFLGDVSFNNITMLRNAGNNTTAFIDEQTVFFPTNTTAVNLLAYPAAYFIDINNDNKVDMLVSPSGDDYSFNVNHIWYYENNTMNNTADFQLQKKDFLLSESLDFGNWSMPVFVDLDADGDKDLIIASSDFSTGFNTSKKCLFAYEQIGTEQAPIYKLLSEDYANLRQYNLARMAPTFGDLDADGDKDILIGLADGTIVFIQNITNDQQAIYAQPIPNYKSIDVGVNAVPFLYDMDKDGDLDLIIGERNGNINYFENIGTAQQANFSSIATSETFGYIDARINGVEGNTAPIIMEWNGELLLLLGREKGDISIYNNISNNLLGAFNLLHRLEGINEGRQSVATAKFSPQANTIQLFVGNKRGGLSAYEYTNTTIAVEAINKDNSLIKIFPNPNAGQEFFIQSNIKFNAMYITNIQGKTIVPFQKINDEGNVISVSLNPILTAGIYLINLIDENGKKYIEKLLIL